MPTSALLSPQKPAPQPMRTIFVISPRFICRATAARAFRLIKVAGYHHETAQTGAVTLIQRFGSALNLNIHFHILFLDGVYVTTGERLTFRRIPPPTVATLEKLVHVISKRVGRTLERQGLLVRDFESSFLTLDPADVSDFDDLLGHSITYRIALGPHQGRKAFTLQTVPAVAAADDHSSVAKAAGFSLHAGVASEAHEREKLERLCRYITRPAVSTERLSLTAQGNIRYRLKNPYRDGTTEVVLLRASCPSPCGPAFGCSKSLPTILSSRSISWPGWPRWCRRHGSILRATTACSRRTIGCVNK